MFYNVVEQHYYTVTATRSSLTARWQLCNQPWLLGTTLHMQVPGRSGKDIKYCYNGKLILCTCHPNCISTHKIPLNSVNQPCIVAVLETRVGYMGRAGDCFWNILETCVCHPLSRVHYTHLRLVARTRLPVRNLRVAVRWYRKPYESGWIIVCSQALGMRLTY